MHQFRTSRLFLRVHPRTRRLLGGTLIALTLGTGLTIARMPKPRADGVWEALCAAFEPGSLYWYVYECYLLPPGGGSPTV